MQITIKNTDLDLDLELFQKQKDLLTDLVHGANSTLTEKQHGILAGLVNLLKAIEDCHA
jgi:hypothetical protein